MSEWRTKALGEIIRLNYGKSLAEKKRTDGPVPVFGSNGIVGTHIDPLVNEGGLIIGRKGSAGLVHRSHGPFFPIDTTFYITASDAPAVDLDFLFYLLKHIDLTRIRGDVGVPGLNREMAYLETIRYTSDIAEQKAIAYILSSVQQAIEAQERIIQTTTELKQALMQKLFSEGVRGEPQKETEIGLVPESWEICTVGNVAVIQSGGTPAREEASNWERGTIPWVKTGEINYCTILETEEKITHAGLANSAAKLFPPGTLLMAMYGQGVTRGRVAMLGIEAATNQACAAFIPMQTKTPNLKYLFYYFQHHYEDLRRLGHGANQKNMNAALIRSFSLALPEPAEQQEIAKSLSTIDRKLTLHDRNLTQLQSLFSTLLYELMSSRILIKAPSALC